MPNDDLQHYQTDNDDNSYNNNATHHKTINALRERLIEALPRLSSNDIRHQAWLLGTTGCHLCEVAESLMNQLAAVQPVTYHYIDISDLNETLMMDFATTIPVVLTPLQRLDYPFSVLDLQQLLSEESLKTNE
ncbi:glutaredoxin family protein [Psychrobacter sp. 2Y5]|uniref:glutaredoxin family protein n=1 Tax=unclassified Psychrobacter TaxID=196806 RepID=UPI003F4490BC